MTVVICFALRPSSQFQSFSMLCLQIHNKPVAQAGVALEALHPENKRRLELDYHGSVLPMHPKFLMEDYGIMDVLCAHADSSVDWRYLHETLKCEKKDPANFHTSPFVATLQMVLAEFRKRYRTVEISWPPLSSL